MSSVDHPDHYNQHPSGIECIDVIEEMPLNIGNAMKYLWRCGLKGDDIEQLEKAKWYIQREIQRRKKKTKEPPCNDNAFKGAEEYADSEVDRLLDILFEKGFFQSWSYLQADEGNDKQDLLEYVGFKSSRDNPPPNT